MSNRLSVEDIIRNAQQEGLFNNLPGKGKPLAIDPSPDALVNGILKEANVKPEWVQLAHEIEQLIRESERLLESYAVEYSAERAALMGTERVPCESQSEPWWRRWQWTLVTGYRSTPVASPGSDSRRRNSMAAFHHHWDITLERYASLLHRANGKIRPFNHLVPVAGQQRVLIPLEERLQEFTDRFPRFTRTEDGALRPVQGTVPRSLLEPPLKGDKQEDEQEDPVIQRRRHQEALQKLRRSRCR